MLSGQNIPIVSVRVLGMFLDEDVLIVCAKALEIFLVEDVIIVCWSFEGVSGRRCSHNVLELWGCSWLGCLQRCSHSVLELRRCSRSVF